MSLNSYEFIFVFLPVTVVGHQFLLRLSGRPAAIGWLIFASIVFYARCSLTSLILVTPSILLDYLIARILVSSSAGTRLQKFVFVLGVTANILFLCYFKYKNFFLETTNSLFVMKFEVVHTALPLGISFLTFQKIAFLTDVHSGQIRSVSLLDYLLFTLFFPRTIAGPIVRFHEISPQLKEIGKADDIKNIVVGLCLFSVGLFKKAVIADNLAPFVPLTFDQTQWFLGHPPDLLTAWVGALTYTFQLYFDFSGYSDMALGVARVFGIRLPANFNSPLKATSIVDYWSRWHITLTRFLTSYIYTPIVLNLTRARQAKGRPILRGKRSSPSALVILVIAPTLITMTISGLWHGAGWRFVVWGLLHGAYISINQIWRMLRPHFWPDEVHYRRVMKPIGFGLTFGCVVSALVFFRAESVSSALSILSGMVGMNGVVPYEAQLLQHVGAHVSWNLMAWEFLPNAPIVWVVALLPVVTLFPNSLEILRRFQPALDFPSETPLHVEQAPASGTTSEGGSERVSATERRAATWTSALRIGREGVALGSITAIVFALLFTLGALAANHGDAFLYGQF